LEEAGVASTMGVEIEAMHYVISNSKGRTAKSSCIGHILYRLIPYGSSFGLDCSYTAVALELAVFKIESVLHELNHTSTRRFSLL
jgi:hypothetical protein